MIYLSDARCIQITEPELQLVWPSSHLVFLFFGNAHSDLWCSRSPHKSPFLSFGTSKEWLNRSFPQEWMNWMGASISCERQPAGRCYRHHPRHVHSNRTSTNPATTSTTITSPSHHQCHQHLQCHQHHPKHHQHHPRNSIRCHHLQRCSIL